MVFCALSVCVSHTEVMTSQGIHTETRVPKIGASKVIVIIQPPLLKMDKYFHFHAVWHRRNNTVVKHFLFPMCGFSPWRRLAACDTDVGENPTTLSNVTVTSRNWYHRPCEKPVISSSLTRLLEKKCTRFTVWLLIPLFLNCFYLNKCTKRGYNVKLHFVVPIVQNPDQTVHPKKIVVLIHMKLLRERSKLQVL